jgi:PleD family two-component response regulator
VGPNVTLSVGLAVAEGTGQYDSAAALLKAADAALYEAKNSGRHRAALAR